MNEFDRAFELCKEQASIDGAVSEDLLRHWFQASWDLCAQMTGFVFPARQVTEPLTLDCYGKFHLSYRPSSEIKIYDGYRLVATFPANWQDSDCAPSLCCYCNLKAQYTVGQDACEVSPTFLQAVARVFTYICENRGDTELDEAVLGKSGAKVFLNQDLTYVA